MIYKLLALTALAATTASGYMLGEDVPICWETDMVSGVRTQLAECPEGLNIEFTKFVPEVIYEQKTYESVFKFTVDPSKGFNVKPQVNKAGVEVGIPHANIHSCLAKIGFCTPFVGNTPGLATHTKALDGDFSTDGFAVFTNDVALTAESYTIIAHGRVFVNDGNTKYDVAAAYRRTVLPPENQIVVPESTKMGMLSMSVASVVILAGLVVGAVFWRKHKVMKFSQVEFLIVMLVCAMITSVGSLTMGFFELSETVCALRPWVTMFPLVVMFSFLFAKTFRVLRIFNNKSLKKQYHKAGAVYMQSAVISGIFGLILAAAQVFSPNTVQRDYAPRDLINFQLVCKGENDEIFNMIQTAYVAILLVVGLLMTKKSASITVLFNESKHVAFAMQNMAFLSVVILPTASAVKAQPGPVFILYGIGLTFAALITSCALMLPKFKLIRSGAEIVVAGATKTSGNTTRSGSVTTPVTGGNVSKSTAPIKVRNGALPSVVVKNLEGIDSVVEKILNKYNGGLACEEANIDDLKNIVSKLSATLDRVQFVNNRNSLTSPMAGAGDVEMGTTATAV